MSVSLSVVTAFLLCGLVLALVWVFRNLSHKNKELSAEVEVLSKRLALLQDSQVGLGKHLLALERRLTQGQPKQDRDAGAEGAAESGTLNRIAQRLSEGAEPSALMQELGVSESEVRLVELVLRSTADSVAHDTTD